MTFLRLLAATPFVLAGAALYSLADLATQIAGAIMGKHNR